MKTRYAVVLAALMMGGAAGAADNAATLRRQAEQLRQQAKQLNEQANKLDKDAKSAAFAESLTAVKPKKERKILIYSRTTGFRHKSIGVGAAALTALGTHTGAYASDHTEDPAVFTDEKLAQYDGILMLSTTGEPIPAGEARASVERFLSSGKALIGIHAATDCHKSWPAYLNAIGGLFDGHPWTANSVVTLYNEEPEHPVTKAVPQGFKIRDEIYQYKDEPYFSRTRLRILLSLDLAGENMMKKGMKRADHDYAVSWIHNQGGARVFYSNLGHNESTFADKVAMQHFLDGIQWALGDVEADARPSAEVGKKPKGLPQ